MGSDATARIGYGIDLEDKIPDWLAELFEDESQLPKELEIVHYGKADIYNGVFIALKRTYQWVWETQPKPLTDTVREMLMPNLDELNRLELQDALKRIPGFPEKKATRANPKWMLLANYC